MALVLVQSCLHIGVIAHFKINQKYYAEVLCVNKNRPELACEGKCVLMQRLKHNFEENQAAENQKLRDFLERDLTLFCDALAFLTLNFSPRNVFEPKTTVVFAPQFSTQCALSGIFHPPSVRV